MLGYSPGIIGIQAQSDTGTGLLAKSPVRAGQFDGPVVINGNLTVNGTLNGHAASAETSTASAQHPARMPTGASARRSGSRQPDQLLEDVGEGTLVQGKATVKLDADFAGLLRGAKYHVFLSPRATATACTAPKSRHGGFEIRELKAGTSGVGFSYRILARLPRQAGTRLERVAPATNAAPTNAQPQTGNAPKPVQPIPVPDVVKEDLKPRGGPRNGSER